MPDPILVFIDGKPLKEARIEAFKGYDLDFNVMLLNMDGTEFTGLDSATGDSVVVTLFSTPTSVTNTAQFTGTVVTGSGAVAFGVTAASMSFDPGVYYCTFNVLDASASDNIAAQNGRFIIEVV